MGQFTQEMRDKAAATRAKNAADKAERQRLAGIEDGKRFIAAEGTFSDNPVWNCHVGGIPVSELFAGREAEMRLLYRQTDEGIAEANAGKTAVTDHVRDAGDKDLDHRRDVLRDQEPERFDPLAFMKDHTPPGFRAKLLSNRTGQVNPDYQIAKDKGEPVKYKGMFVGVIPEHLAEAKTRRIAERTKMRMAQLTQQHKQTEGMVVPSN